MSRPITRLRHPRHLKQLYASWPLRVLKHEHTGRAVHHQHTSYPVLALLLLATAAVLGHSTLSTYALGDGGGAVVSSVVSGPAPATAATIDKPTTGSAFTSLPITVSGTCQIGSSYVQLYRNHYASGTAACTTSGHYAIQTDLFNDTNDLVVKTYNLANVAGPDSNTVRVTYTPPADSTPAVQGSGDATSGSSTGPSDTTSGSSATSSAEPLTIHNDYLVRGYDIGQSASWQVAVQGGVAPYAVSVAWGDGETALYTSTVSQILTLTHTYKTVPPDNSGFSIIVNITDAIGTHTSLQILALITNTAVAAGTATTGIAGNAGAAFAHLKVLGISLWPLIGSLWVTFGSIAAILLAFWLGERRELKIIRTKFRMKKL